MIHLFEILIIIICFGIILFSYKKISKNPENKKIAIISTIIVSISLITLVISYFWSSYNQNIDWSFMRPEWQEVNTKDWNDVNYIRDQIGQYAILTSAITNPIMSVVVFLYILDKAMTGNPQPIDQFDFISFMVIPTIVSLIIYIILINGLLIGIRRIFKK